MYGYEDQDGHLDSVARSCKQLKSRSGSKAANAEEGISCSICSSWDGNGCTRKAYDFIRTKLELD